MPLRRPGVFTRLPAPACRLLAALLILGAAAAHLAYLVRDCPLDLAPDEAHYWDWSRHLDWSYYSKGPLVALLIRAGTALAGGWAEQLTGTMMPAVRLPAVLCGSLLLVSLYVLTVQVYGREPLALAVVALALTLPPVAVGSSLMTIDAPYTCCWGWALVLTHRALFRGSGWAWGTAGAAVGVGILAKYTMVLFLPSLGLFLLATPGYRRQLLRPGFWCLAGVAALSAVPILVWNAGHDWVGVRHLLALAGFGHEAGRGADAGSPLHWWGPAAYVGGQCGILLVFWFAAWAAAMAAHRPWAEPDPRLRYLWWLSAPTFLCFLAFSPKTAGGELNWPVTAYLSGLVLAAGWLERQLTAPADWYRRWTAANLVLACAAGVAVTLVMHHSEWLRPAVSRLVGPPTPERPLPVRRLDPTCRLRGWQTLAREVDRLRQELAAAGVEPVLAGTNWSMPGELGFYCAGRPQAYSLGLVGDDRHSQYDWWPNPLENARDFLGRTFIVVGEPDARVLAGFERADPARVVTHEEGGHPLAFWTITVCRGYKGYPPEAWARRGRTN
jgi:4-amino-4-deoxy-L-arabinose transferase-like glycosyltransferase